MTTKTMAQALRCSLLAAPLLLAACGGGGSDAGTDPGSNPDGGAATNAEGVYAGTLTGSSSSEFRLLVLPDGQYWALYGQTSGSNFVVAGFVQGTGTSAGGSFSSGNSRDFGIFPAAAGTLAATYNTVAKTIAGSINQGGASVGFSGGPIPGSPYNYMASASLATIAGAWLGTNSGGESVALNIQPDGSLSATTSGGCAATGTALPRTDGRNVFTVTLLQGVGCALQGQTIRGVVLAYPLASGQTQLVGAVVDDARSAGVALFATR